MIAARRDRAVRRSAVSRCPVDRAVDLIQQRRHLSRTVGILMREGPRHDHTVVGIDRQMRFAPFGPRLRAAFRIQPLTRPVDPPAGSIDKRNGPRGTEAGWVTVKSPPGG